MMLIIIEYHCNIYFFINILIYKICIEFIEKYKKLILFLKINNYVIENEQTYL